MKSKEFERLSPTARRRFLKVMGAALAAPLVPEAFRYAAYDMCGVANAGVPPTPRYFIEINLRDQWDHSHFFVAPSLATKTDLRRGEAGSQCYMFYSPNELTQRPNRVYLTPESMELDPHVDTIAMIDCCEVATGAIHGHEAGNPMRSPGRTYTQGNGRSPMYLNDPVDNFPQGVEQFYSSTPTPASFYNYINKKNDPAARNGIAFKGISRGIHTAYHYGAGLTGSELDRIQSKELLFQAFPDTVEDLNVLESRDQASAMAEILRKVDPKFMDRRRFAKSAITTHEANLEEAKKLLFSDAKRVVSLPLTAEETAYWGTDIPDQVGVNIKAQIWEQVAYAYKLVESDQCRSVSLEFDYVDVHPSDAGGTRARDVLDTETKQAARSIARLITKLKEAGIYDRTLISVFCTDGGREARADSYGNAGKNTVILAGGMIRGGYYGDIAATGDDGSGHTFGYAAPRVDNGQPGAFSGNNDGRLGGAYVWRTIMKALSVDDAELTFPDVQVAPLAWLLNT